MELYRLVIVSDETGTLEDVTFMDVSNDSPAEDFCLPNQTVSFDGIITADLPFDFPLESTLRKQ